MLAASGAAVGAPAFLAACGETVDSGGDRSEDADPALLNVILEQHLAVAELANGIDNAVDVGIETVTALRKARQDSIAQLEEFVAEREGEAVTDPAEFAQAESAIEALTLQLEGSIEASLASIGELSSPAYRQAVHRFITEDAAAAAALRSVTGDEVAPDAFVFGAPGSSEGSE